jgi:hypothetical protein
MAYDPTAFRIAEEMLRAESSRRLQRLGEEIGRVKTQAALLGALSSSGMIYGFADVCANEIESSATRAWEVVHRVLVTTGVQASPGLATELKREMEELLLSRRAGKALFGRGGLGEFRSPSHEFFRSRYMRAFANFGGD